MICVVLDVDDTLIDTSRRMQAVWRQVLRRTVPLDSVESLSLEQIFMKYATPEQMNRAKEFQKRFWDVLLCLDPVGVESLSLHRPVPFAAEALQKWSKRAVLVYLTGRTENTRKSTLDELNRFGFPTNNTQLTMFNAEDYARPRGENPSGRTLIEARSKLLSTIVKQYNVVRAVDDFPGYFPIYKEYSIPDRIGFLRSRRYSLENYIDRGATRVVEHWKQLKDDLPKPRHDQGNLSD